MIVDNTGTLQVHAQSGGSSGDPVISLDDAKRQLSVTSDDDDDLITDLIAAAIDHVERSTGLVLTSRQVVERVRWSRGLIDLRSWPLQSVDAITYSDGSGVDLALDASLYSGSLAVRPGRLGTLHGRAWPWGRGEALITVTAGFASRDQIPATVFQAIRILIAEFYANREAGAISTDVQRSLNWLLREHKVKRL